MPKTPDPDHFPSKTDKALHVQIDGAEEGGACLTGHSTSYSDACSCTYRWQAVRESRRRRREVYNKVPKVNRKEAKNYQATRNTPAGFLPTSQYDTASGGRYPSPTQYSDSIALPQPGDWQVFGPTRADMKDATGKLIPPGQNFTTWTWPYWNNAHHVIPKGTFNQTIEAIPDADCQELVRAGLLRAEYNINHHINVILLPMDKEVARVLTLPRHLVLEDESIVKEKDSKFNHRAYNTTVKLELDIIIDAYKNECDQKRKNDCDAWKTIKLSKDRLEELSKHCYSQIIQFGTASPGEAISAIPPLDLNP